MKKSRKTSVRISIARQRLSVERGRATQRSFPISTSKYGFGSAEGSLKTPIGRFRIAEKIGAGNPTDTAYKSRQPVRASTRTLQEDDLVMSRILWLDGLEPANANTFERYIYIHGTNHEEQIGEPASHGCIRMRNADVAELFDLVEVDTPVVIVAPRRSPRADREARKAFAKKR
ncbi:MAG: L,D-transpeptidase [Verrucomicrobiota bacterium]|nr:L,D-transpeptidase [Verrucomicrobiota bacterium]